MPRRGKKKAAINRNKKDLIRKKMPEKQRKTSNGMNEQEKQYYENLRLSRLEDRQSQDRKKEEEEKQGEEAAGQAAGKAAQTAAIASGVGAPLAFLAKKFGEKAGKKIHKKRKILIIAIILAIVSIPIIIIGFIVLISAMFYIIVCSSSVGWLADKALDLIGKGFCQ